MEEEDYDGTLKEDRAHTYDITSPNQMVEGFEGPLTFTIYGINTRTINDDLNRRAILNYIHEHERRTSYTAGKHSTYIPLSSAPALISSNFETG